MLAIRTERLRRTFDVPGKRGEAAPTVAVDELTLSVAAGEIFGLVGPDGAGKTTTMRLQTSILPPTAGEAWVNELHVVRQADAVKELIGYVPQRFGLYPDLTVMENIDFYADIYGVAKRSRGERIEQLLGFANLMPFKRRLAGNLSGGMKQKLGLVCALIHTPRVLLLDEPTNGVDPVSRRDFWRILYQLLAQGVTIFVSTAYLDEAERCTRVGLIHSGRLLACGSPAELKKLVTASIVEIQTPATVAGGSRAAVRVLRPLFGPDALKLFGDRLHLVTDQPDRDIERASAALAKAGLVAPAGAASMRTIPPTLEDVFVAVLSGTGGRHAE